MSITSSCSKSGASQPSNETSRRQAVTATPQAYSCPIRSASGVISMHSGDSRSTRCGRSGSGSERCALSSTCEEASLWCSLPPACSLWERACASFQAFHACGASHRRQEHVGEGMCNGMLGCQAAVQEPCQLGVMQAMAGKAAGRQLLADCLCTQRQFLLCLFLCLCHALRPPLTK